MTYVLGLVAFSLMFALGALACSLAYVVTNTYPGQFTNPFANDQGWLMQVAGLGFSSLAVFTTGRIYKNGFSAGLLLGGIDGIVYRSVHALYGSSGDAVLSPRFPSPDNVALLRLTVCIISCCLIHRGFQFVLDLARNKRVP